MSEVAWRRLHPLSPVVNLLPQMWVVLQQFWPLILVWFIGGAASDRGFTARGAADSSLLVILVGISVLRSWARWWTLRFRVLDGQLELRSGLVNLQTRVLTPQRVQNVELTQSLLQRLFGLAELRVETASDAGAEGNLSALSLAEAQELATWLRSAQKAEATAPTPVAELSTVDLLIYGATSSRSGFAAAAFGTIFEYAASLDPERAARLGLRAGPAGILAAVALALSAGWLFGVAGAALRHGGFRLEDQGGTLVATEGLLSRRRVELPIRRVQRVIVSMPAVRRWLGYATLHIETAVSRRGEGGTQQSTCTIPLVPLDQVDDLAARVLPVRGLLEGPYAPAAVKAQRRALVRGPLQALPFVAIATWLAGWTGLAALALAPLFMLLAWLDLRSQGWCVTPSHVLVRRGWLAREITALDRARIQAVSLQQGPILRRLDLAELVVLGAGARVVLPALDHDVAMQVLGQLGGRR